MNAKDASLESRAAGGGRQPAERLRRLRQLVIEKGLLRDAEWEELEQRSRWLEQPIDRLLLKEGQLTDTQLRDLLADLSGWPVTSLVRVEIAPDTLRAVPAEAVVRYRIIPLEIRGGMITLATDRIPDPDEEDQLRILLGYSPAWKLCTAFELSECIKHFYGIGLEGFLSASARRPQPGAAGPAGAAPDIPRFVEQIIAEAVDANATDIHFEPYEETLRVRLRIDGVLYPVTLPAGSDPYRRAIVSSIKVMAQLNIAEKRLPQDGRFTHESGGVAIDVRVSVLPTRFGEAVNLRLLNRQATFLTLDELGLSETQRADLEHILNLPHGIVLFTGPTGSGKTTSLYAALARLNNTERKIITLEDPIEYQIPGVVQMQVQQDIGFTFPAGLRSILRHDPDVVLIGEIRDAETAGIAVSAALTGHMVFSTLHTNDSASAAVRLIDMGIEPYLVSSSLQGVVAQRLLRRICTACREEAPEQEALQAALHRLFPDVPPGTRFQRGRGCPACRFLGYKGRRAIFEIFLMHDALRQMIVQRVSSHALMQRAEDLGLVTLRRSGWSCALQGSTTVEDVLRITLGGERTPEAVTVPGNPAGP